MTDWQARLSDPEATLLDDLQRGFPVEERPYEAVAAEVGADERTAHQSVTSLRERGLFRRLGPVLNPPVIGSSALAALSVPRDRVDEVAAVVNAYDEVNHNYRRAHEWNLWFVVTAPSRSRRDAIVAEIESRTGLSVLTLPMRTQYYIGLEFPVVHEEALARQPRDRTDAVTVRPIPSGGLDLTPLQARLVVATQDGLPESRTPYRDLANALETTVEAVLSAVSDLQDRYAIKRIGGVVNHHRLGFDANCMVVWQVPEAAIDDRGLAAARHPSVTYCCRRVSRPADGWPYTLFTMIHGRSRAAVEETIDDLATSTLPYDHARLYTTDVCKQTGVTYRDLVPSTGEGRPA